MNRKGVTWLYKELPQLLSKGILSPEAAQNLKTYYGPSPSKMGQPLLVTLFAIVGSVLLGLGVILVVGHNWDKLSNIARLTLMLAVLLLAQILAGYALWRKGESRAWLEGSGTFLTLAIGAVIALVGQTYHLVDDFQNFMLVWLLLVLPLIYILKAKSVACLYLIGITVWLFSVQSEAYTRQGAWLLLACLGPFYWELLKKSRYENSTVILSWLYIIIFYFAFSLNFAFKNGLADLLFASLFSVFYFAGNLLFSETSKILHEPWQGSALLGGLGLSFSLSFKNPWLAFGHTFFYKTSLTEYIVALGLIIVAVVLGFLLAKKGQFRKILLGSWFLLVCLGYLLQNMDPSGIASSILVNLYLLAVILNMITEGLRKNQMSLLNRGMLFLMVLILLRFFDFTYSFVARGLVFIFLGMAFLGVNLVLARRKGGA